MNSKVQESAVTVRSSGLRAHYVQVSAAGVAVL